MSFWKNLLGTKESAKSPATPEQVSWFLDAATKGDLETVKSLIKEHPELVFSQNQHNGRTALHWAAAHGHADIVRLLLVNGADVKAENCYGLTPVQCIGTATQMREEDKDKLEELFRRHGRG